LPEEYHKMYRDLDLSPGKFPAVGHPIPRANSKTLDATARVYGMVTNIDDNMGRLLGKLEELELARNTLTIFITDNGPQQPRYNAGMRDRKGNVHEGGIRVPCFIRWPGRFEGGRVIDRIAAHIDLFPTILEACGASPPAGVKIDGRSLYPLLVGSATSWPDRTLFFQWHRGDEAELYRAFAARTQRFKLVQGRGAGRSVPREEMAFELFDMERDPLELRDIAGEKPEIVEQLKKAYEDWFRDVTGERGFAPPRIGIGSPMENPTVLTRQDWRGPRASWGPRGLGHWEVQVQSSGPYDVLFRFTALSSPGKAHLQYGEMKRTLDLAAGAATCTFQDVRLQTGPGRFSPWLEDEKGEFGVYQVEVRRK